MSHTEYLGIIESEDTWEKKTFQSDFRLLADYFVQRRKNKDYVPSKGTIQHVDTLLQMMAALTHDKYFEEISGTWEGEKVGMGELLLERIEQRGEQKN